MHFTADMCRELGCSVSSILFLLYMIVGCGVLIISSSSYRAGFLLRGDTMIAYASNERLEFKISESGEILFFAIKFLSSSLLGLMLLLYYRYIIVGPLY
jgi:hypothetical protein